MRRSTFNQVNSTTKMSMTTGPNIRVPNASLPRVCPSTAILPGDRRFACRGESGSAGRVHGGTAAFRTPAVTFGHLEKEEPRAGGGSRLLSLDLFEPRGGVSGDGGCRSARAEAPKGERQLQLHLSVVRPECLYRCRAGRKEKSRLLAAAQVPYSLMARLRRHPPVRADLERIPVK